MEQSPEKPTSFESLSSLQTGPSPYKPSRFRYIWIGIVLVLVLSVVGVGSYIIDHENQTLPITLGALVTPTPDVLTLREQKVTPPPIKQNPRYTNDTYGFSFRYPATWNYTEEVSDETIYPLLEVSLLSREHVSSSSGNISIAIYHHGYKTIDAFISDYCGNKQASCSAYMPVAGKVAKKVMNEVSLPDSEMIVFQNGQDIYRAIVELPNPETEATERKVFEEILTSFVFTASPSGSLSTTKQATKSVSQ